MLADLRFAWRQCLKAPGFTAVVMLTLAIAIGPNAAIFSVVNAVLLEPLPYPDSSRIMAVSERPHPREMVPWASGGAFVDWEDHSTQFESLAAAHASDENLTGIGEPLRVSGLEVSARYFHVFGIKPLLGRDFTAEEDSPKGNHDVVILSHELWQAKFGGDPAIIGKTVHFDLRPLTVIGVLPPRALFANSSEFFVPSSIRSGGHKLSRDYGYVVTIVGRLKPGASAARAEEELTVSRHALKQLYPVFKQEWTVGVVPLHEQLFGDLRPDLLLLLAAVGLLLLIACANVANLLLARSAVRQAEIAVRSALGASTARILRQLLIESLMLAVAGGAVGLLLGGLAIRPLVAFTGLDPMTGGHVRLNLPVVCFALVASLLTGLAFGIVPALKAARAAPQGQLKEGARGSTSGSRHRLQSTLLISETALTVVLLVVTGLLLRSFVRAMNEPPGFNPEHVLLFDVSLSNSKTPTIADKVRFGQRLLQRLQAVPGVRSAGIGSGVPMNGNNMLGDLISREDQPETRNDYSAGFDSVGGDFFPALQIPLLQGRLLTDRDDSETAPKVMVVNDTLARRLFGRDDPIGRQLHFKDAEWEIVGVVGSVRRLQLDRVATPQVYFARTYFPWMTTVVLRTDPPPLSMVSAVREAVRSVDPNLPLANLTTLDDAVLRRMQTRRTLLTLLGLFAGTALILACVGIYGVVSYSVAQRTREVGIRMALGAASSQVIALVLRQGLIWVAVGAGVGIAASLAAGSIVASQLYATSSSDPLVAASVVLLLFGVAVLSIWIPARRISRVDPAVALRAE